MSPTRVAHVLYGGLGGHATVVFDIIQGSGLQQSLVFLSPEPPLQQYTELATQLGVPFAWVRADGRRLSYPLRIRRAIRSQRPAVIVVHSAGAALVAAAMGLMPKGPAVIYVEHHSWPLRDRTMRLASIVSLARADAVVALSDEYADRLRETFPRLPHERLHVIPNGVDTTIFRPSRFRPAAHQAQTILIGMQSRLTPIKDHRTLLVAMQHLVNDGLDVRLRIAGDGGELGNLQQLTHDLGLDDHVDFEGLLDQSSVVHFLQELDIYVHATLGEASSTAILQAMASGLPIVASDVSGVGTMVSGELGALVPPRDAGALAVAIKRLITSPDDRNKAAEKARQRAVDAFDISKIRERHLQLQRAVLQGRLKSHAE